MLALEHEGSDNGEDGEGDDFLYHLQLHERVRASVANETQFVGWHLQQILKEGDGPREANHRNQRPTVGNVHLLQLEVTIPSQSHEDIAAYQQQYCVESIYHKFVNLRVQRYGKELGMRNQE